MSIRLNTCWLREKQFLGLALLSMLLFGLAGCNGDDSGGGPSLGDQFRDAMKLNDPETKARKLAGIGQQQLKAKDNPGAAESFKEASKAAAKVTDPLQQASVYIALAVKLSASDDSDLQKETVRSLATAVDKIESAESKAEKMALLGRLQHRYIDKDVGVATIQAAEEMVPELPDFMGKVTVLSQVAGSYRGIKNNAEANRVMASAVEMTKSIEDPSEQIRSLIEISRAQHKAKEKKAALATLSEALVVADTIDDNPTLAGMRRLDIAEFYVELGEKGLAAKQKDKAHDLVTGKDADSSTAKEVLKRIEQMGQ